MPPDAPAIASAESSGDEQKIPPGRWLDSGVTIEGLKADRWQDWKILVNRLGAIAKDYARRLYSKGATPVNAHDAEDLTMVLIGEFYEDIQKFKTVDAIEAKFRKALRHDLIDLKRMLTTISRGRGKVHSLGDPESLREKPPLPILIFKTNEALEDDASTTHEELLNRQSLVEVVEMNELRIIIFDCVNELKPPEKDIIHLIYADRKHAEIAQVLKVKTADVGTILSRIYKKLRPKILKRIKIQGLADYEIPSTKRRKSGKTNPPRHPRL